MRNRTYRAKRKNWEELPKEKWWVKGAIFEDGETSYIITSLTVTEYEDDTEVEADVIAYLIDPDTICEPTGLTDKKDKKIFDRDIVKTNNGRLCKVVWFSSPQYQGWDLKPIEIKNPVPEIWRLWEDIEVVGNIFDNPELIKI